MYHNRRKYGGCVLRSINDIYIYFKWTHRLPRPSLGFSNLAQLTRVLVFWQVDTVRVAAMSCYTSRSALICRDALESVRERERMQRQAPVAASEAIIILSSRNRSGVFGNCMELINTDVSRYCISGVIVCTSLNQIWALANSLIKLCSFLLSKIEGDLVRFAKRKEREMNPVQIYVIFFRWNIRYKLYVHYIAYK